MIFAGIFTANANKELCAMQMLEVTGGRPRNHPSARFWSRAPLSGISLPKHTRELCSNQLAWLMIWIEHAPACCIVQRELFFRGRYKNAFREWKFAKVDLYANSELSAASSRTDNCLLMPAPSEPSRFIRSEQSDLTFPSQTPPRNGSGTRKMEKFIAVAWQPVIISHISLAFNNH